MKSTIFLRENTWLTRSTFTDFGWGNGYILIPKGHILHGVHYRYIDVDVHGGLTFSELITKELQEKFKMPKSAIGKWCVGFDTVHLRDSLLTWSKSQVLKETKKLQKQIDLLNTEEINLFEIATSGWDEENFLLMTNLTDTQIKNVIAPMVEEERENDTITENEAYVSKLMEVYPNAKISFTQSPELIQF